MKNTNIILVIVALFAVLGIGGYIFLNKTESNDNSAARVGDKVMETASARYVEYSKSAFDGASSRRVLFFYADWCPTCRPADANFKENLSRIPEDVTLIRVNYNDPETDQAERDLAKKYNITYQHTFVQIDADGKEVAKWNGGQIEELLANLK